MKNVAPAPRRQKPLPIPVFDTIAQSSLLKRVEGFVRFSVPVAPIRFT